MLNELSHIAHENAVEKGFYERKRDLPELAMLIITELSEAVEAERKGAKIEPHRQKWANEYNVDLDEWDIDTFNGYHTDMRGTIEEEIADAFIRLLDLCGYYDINIDAWITTKMKYNSMRPKKHGKVY